MSQSSRLSEAVEKLRGAGFDIDYEEEADASHQEWLNSLLSGREATEEDVEAKVVADAQEEPSTIDSTIETSIADDYIAAEMEVDEHMAEQEMAREKQAKETEKEEERRKEEQHVREERQRLQEERDLQEQLERQKQRRRQEEEDARRLSEERQTIQEREERERAEKEKVWASLCAKHTNLQSVSREELLGFQAPLNGDQYKDIYDRATDSAKVMIVDVPADGSCLFHAIFSCVWRELTGEVIRTHTTSPLASLWEASRLYEFKGALEEFSKVEVSAALGAIWSSCTHAMRLFVTATWCFGGNLLTNDRMRSLLCDALEEPQNNSEQYAVTMWTTLAQSIALFRYVKQSDVSEDASARFVRTLTIALASQHLLDTVEREAKALRAALIEHRVVEKRIWSEKTTDDMQRLKYQMFVAEGYETAWFGTLDRALSGCIALTYTTDPYEKHLYPKSYWASVSACEPLSEALGFNIYVLDSQAEQPATDTSRARPAQVNLYPFVAPTPQKDTRDIILYVLGDRNHFGYGLPLDALQEDPVTGCLTQKNPAFRGSDKQLRSTLIAMGNKWIAQHYIDAVPNILSELWVWRNAVAPSQEEQQQQQTRQGLGDDDNTAEHNGVAGERTQCVFDSMRNENTTARQTANLRLNRDTRVLLRAWDVRQEDFDEHMTNDDVEHARTKILQSPNTEELSLLNSAFTVDSSLISGFLDVVQTLNAEIYDPLILLIKRIMPKRDATTVLKGIQTVRETRSFAEFVRRIHSTVSLLISVEHEKIRERGSREAVPEGLADLIDVENAWFEEQYLPFEKSLRNLSETAIRYVLARLHHSRAAPCVVPLYIFGEQVLFCDGRRVSATGSTSLARRPSASVDDLDLYVSSVESGQTATTKRMLDIASGKRIKKVQKGDSLVEFVEQFIVLSILEQYERQENEEYESSEGTGLETVPPLATGFAFTNAETPGKIVYRQDIVEQSRTRRRGDSLEPVCSVRKNGRFDGTNVAANMLALLEPSTCLAENFGWIGPQLRGLTLTPGHGQIDVLGLATGSAIRAERLVARLYALFNIVGANNVLGNFILRGEDIVERTSPTDESALLCPLFRQGGEPADTLLRFIRGTGADNRYLSGFYGNAPTDWLLRHDLRQFLESNRLDEAADYLDWALLNGTDGQRRLSLARSLRIELPLDIAVPTTERLPYQAGIEDDFGADSEESDDDLSRGTQRSETETRGQEESRKVEPKKKKRKGTSPSMKIDRPADFGDVQQVEPLEVYRPPVGPKTAIGQQTVFSATTSTTSRAARETDPIGTFARQGVMTSGIHSSPPVFSEDMQRSTDLFDSSADAVPQAPIGSPFPWPNAYSPVESPSQWPLASSTVGSPVQWPPPSPPLQRGNRSDETAPKVTFEEAFLSQSPLDRMAVSVYQEMSERLPVYAGLTDAPLGSGLERFEHSALAFDIFEEQQEYNQFLDNVAHGLVQSKSEEMSLAPLGYNESEEIVSAVNRWLRDNQASGYSL